MPHCVYNLVLLVIVYTTTRRALSSEMEASKSSSMSYSLSFLLLSAMTACAGAAFHYHDFVVHQMPVKRLCRTHNIIAVNGQYPGPTLVVRNGDTVFIHVTNRAKYNITLHWHGIRQLRTGWADGPEYVTQCPIRPGRSYTYRFKIDEQEGTLWWHAHSSWLRATVYGALIIYPKAGSSYPFPKLQREFPVILGEWWNEDPVHVIQRAIRTGGAPNVSDAYTINGQPGDLYPCSSEGTTIFRVKHGQTNLFRFINAALEDELFISVAGHNMTVVAADAFYTKPFTTSFLMLAPGQTTDVLLAADQPAGGRYYIAAHAFNSGTGITFDNTTTTAIVEYEHGVDYPDKRHRRFAPRPVPAFPSLPAFNDTTAAAAFSARFRSPAPVQLPGPVDHHLFFTVGLGLFNCPPGQTCAGPNGSRLAASMNNVSFQLPMQLSMLQAQYFSVPGVFTTDFPAVPPQPFNYTGSNISQALYQPVVGTRAFPVKYGAVVEVVLQGTNIVTGEEHPMHLHGYHFHVLATGTGNFEPARDVGLFNLVDPPTRNTVVVPTSGWVAIRFLADNPGVWLMHCHLDAHMQSGMAMAFVVENGAGKLQSLGPPPADLPQC